MIKEVGIIGLGNVGKVLATFLKANGMLRWAVSRSATDDANILRNISDIKELPSLIIIAVADKYISAVSEKLAHRFGKELEGVFVFHLSGALSRNELILCENNGAIIASAHPFQTFFVTGNYENSFVDVLDGISWGIDCKAEYFLEIEKFIKKLLGKAKYLSSETLSKKAIYHASAVAVSNYLTAAITLAKKMANLADIEAEDFLLPIIKTTIKNNFSDVDFPITGPIARCDLAVVKEHLDNLSAKPHLQKSYAFFGAALLELIKDEKIISEEQIKQLEAILLQKHLY